MLKHLKISLFPFEEKRHLTSATKLSAAYTNATNATKTRRPVWYKRAGLCREEATVQTNKATFAASEPLSVWVCSHKWWVCSHKCEYGPTRVHQTKVVPTGWSVGVPQNWYNFKRILGLTTLVNGHGDAVGWYDCDEDPGEDEKKDKCVLRELVELDQKLATSGRKTNRAREAESCFGQMKEKHQKMGQKY